ncbi:MAG: Trk system potassium transporter TrkA [Pirellulales bacterium]|nr:Trk system potassium transporter TrkA [Pirellulales bacterium]
MRIVVLGAGTVGSSIAKLLCQNRHSVTVVDTNADHIRHINETHDVRAITGSAAQSSVLFQAGIIGADLCLAVTGIDEVNLVAASMAKAMGARRAVARVYAPVFRDMSTFDYQRHFKIDRLLSLEHLTALELARSIRHPGSVIVENLARGELEVYEVAITEQTKAADVPLEELKLPKSVRIGSIARDGRTWIAGAEDVMAIGDRVTVIGLPKDIDAVKDLFYSESGTKADIVIGGGGETGYHLARILEGQRFNIVLMEADRCRCDFLAEKLDHTTVVHSDATRRESMEEERVGSADVFVACTGDDESNIMAAVEARDLGVETTMAIVQRPDYANVVGKLGIKLAVSPREVMAKQVLGFLNTGPIVSRHALGDGGITVLEVEVPANSPATEHVLANLPLPRQCLIAAVIQDQFARVPGADDRLRAGDTVVALVAESVIDDTIRIFMRKSD